MSCPCNPRTGKCFDPEEEGPSASDLDRFGGESVACPECGAEVYDDSPLCQACGYAMSGGAGRGAAGKGWVVPVAWAVIAAMALAVVLWIV